MKEATTLPPQPLREAKQRRSRILMQSVREATAELLKTLPPDQVTTVKIAARAGISIGSLYRYYPNKEAILTDIYNEELRNLDRRLRADMRPDSVHEPLERVIRDAVVVTVGYHRELLALNATFYIAFRRNFNITDRQGPAADLTWGSWAEQWLLDVLRHNRERLKITDLQAAARLIFDMCIGTIHRIIDTRPEALQDELLIDQLTDLVCGYLL